MFSANFALRGLRKEVVHSALAIPKLNLIIEIDSDCNHGEIIAWKKGSCFAKSNSSSLVDRVYLMKRSFNSNDRAGHSFKGRLRSDFRVSCFEERAKEIFESATYDLVTNNCQHLAHKLADYATDQ